MTLYRFIWEIQIFLSDIPDSSPTKGITVFSEILRPTDRCSRTYISKENIGPSPRNKNLLTLKMLVAGSFSALDCGSRIPKDNVLSTIA